MDKKFIIIVVFAYLIIAIPWVVLIFLDKTDNKVFISDEVSDKAIAINSHTVTRYDNHDLITKYGVYADDVFDSYSEIVTIIRDVFPQFDMKMMSVVMKNYVINADSTDYLILNGCTEHNCGDSYKIIAYDEVAGKIYVFSQEGKDKLSIYGNPPSIIKDYLLAEL